MKIILLISLALASTVYAGAMACGNDSCLVNRDPVQVNADSTQLSDPAQGHIFDRNIDGWVVNSCPSTSIILGYVDVEKLMKLRRSKYTTLKSPWEKDPRDYGVHGKFKLNGNKQTSNPENSTPWWIQE